MRFDRPIETAEQDMLDRRGFAAQIASTLVLARGQPSLVVGIEGKWGSGKTSILNLIREELRRHKPVPLVVDFSPWLISSLDSLIEGFLLQLATGIGKKSRDREANLVARKLLQFATMLVPISLVPGVEPWGTLVGKVLSSVGSASDSAAKLAELDLPGRKSEIGKHLAKLDKPIVVTIDDVDRLPPDQIRILLQMIKAVCDFPLVSYLVAYDPIQVASAMSYGGTIDGSAYCEKIVQYAYPVPRMGFFHSRAVLDAALAPLLNTLSLSQREQNLLTFALDQTEVVRALSTPRDAIRVVNRLHVSAPALHREVCFPDLLVYESLSLRYPAVARFVADNLTHFISHFSADVEVDTQDRNLLGWEAIQHTPPPSGRTQEPHEPSWLPHLLSSYTESDRARIRSLLYYLFPKLRTKLFGTANEPPCENRLHDRDCFLKVLHCGATAFTFSAVAGRKFCENPTIRDQALGDLVESGSLSRWCLNMISLIPHVPVVDPVDFGLSLCRILSGPSEWRTIDRVEYEAGDLLGEMIASIDRHEEQLSCLRALTTQRDCLVVAETTLLRFAVDLGMWDRGVYYPPATAESRPHRPCPITAKELVELKDQWLLTVRAVADDRGIFESQRQPFSVLFRWAQFNNNNYDEVGDLLLRCAEDSSWLRMFVKAFHTIQLDQLRLLIGRNATLLADKISEIADGDDHSRSLAEFLRQPDGDGAASSRGATSTIEDTDAGTKE